MDTSKNTTVLRTLTGRSQPTMPRTERALFALTGSAKAAIEALRIIMDKLARGEKLVESDRQAYEDAVLLIPDQLIVLLGMSPRHSDAFVRDNEKAQQEVDEFVAELLENEDELTVSQYKALTDPEAESSSMTMRWRDYVSITEHYVVDVTVPDAIADDCELLQKLESHLDCIVRDDLEQDPDRGEHDTHDSEYELSSG